MRICIPILAFGRAGGMKVLSEFGNRASKFGHEVVFISSGGEESPYYKLNCKIEYIDEGGDICLSHSCGRSLYARMKAIYLFLKKYSKAYDAVIANYYLTAYPVYFGSNAANFYYIQAYEPEFAEFHSGLKRFFAKFIAWTSYFLPIVRVVNSDIYAKYKNLTSNYVVRPGIDLEVFSPIKTNGNTVFTVGCIGRDEVWKGSQDVADAVQIFEDRNYNIKFKVAFHPVLSRSYELVQPFGHKGLADFYRSLDVLVAPGHIQLGAVHYPVIEAMACGIPVVTTGYFPANDSNSYIVPIKSPEAIAEALIAIYHDREESSKRALIALSDIKQLSWDVIAAKFFAIVESRMPSR